MRRITVQVVGLRDDLEALMNHLRSRPVDKEEQYYATYTNGPMETQNNSLLFFATLQLSSRDDYKKEQIKSLDQMRKDAGFN